jgi:hypothetical protein
MLFLRTLQIPFNELKLMQPTTTLTVCGIELNGGRWRVSEEHRDNVMRYSQQLPTTIKELRKILGLIQFNRMLWQSANLSVLASPFYALLNKDATQKKIVKTDELIQAWKDLFEPIRFSYLYLHALGERLSDAYMWVVCSDASHDGAAGCLWRLPRPADLSLLNHRYMEEHGVVVDGWSLRFTNASSRWPIFDKESYSIVKSLLRFKLLLQSTVGQTLPHFAVLNDNTVALHNWESLAYPLDTIRARRWISWQDQLGSLLTYSIHWQHISGTTNILADMMSRVIDELHPLPQEDYIFSITDGQAPLSDPSTINDMLGQIRQLQREDKVSTYVDVPLHDVISTLSTTASTSDCPKTQALIDKRRFVLRDQLLYFCRPDGAPVLYVPLGGNFVTFANASTSHTGLAPVPARTFILWSTHDVLGHPGRDSTISKISALYWWPGMHKEIKSYCSKCYECALQAKNCTNSPVRYHPVPKDRFTVLSLDHVDPRRPPYPRSDLRLDHHGSANRFYRVYRGPGLLGTDYSNCAVRLMDCILRFPPRHSH